MAFEIPAEMIDAAAEAFDATLAQFGKDCRLELPRTRDRCPNCGVSTADGRSDGVYTPGGPTDFPAGGVCPVCQGEGFVEEPQAVTIKMRLHENPAEWVGKVPAQVPDGTIQARAKLEHYALIRTAERMAVDAEGYRDRSYQLWGDPVDAYGILANRYVVCWWRRA